jgi:hypothetical protein
VISGLHSDDKGQHLVGHHSRTGAFTAFGARPSWACTLFKGSAFWPTARWRRRSGPVAVGQADLVGLTAAAMLVTNWTHLRARLIQAQQAEAEATGTGP